jgi:hypothetical protein
MILVRFVCQAKFGKAGEVVAGFKQSGEITRTIVEPHVSGRILSDLSGPFDTVIMELEVESLAEWERLKGSIFANPQIQEAEASLPYLIESGQAEFFTIEGTWHGGGGAR